MLDKGQELFVYLSLNLQFFVEKRQELTLLSAFSSYLTKSNETEDPENPESRMETEAVEVTLISK